MPLSWTCGPSARGRACRAGRGEFVVAKNVSATKPAEKCLNDLRVFGDQMEKDGHWLGGAGYGYGYPMGEIGYGYSYPVGGASAAAATGYMDAAGLRGSYAPRLRQHPSPAGQQEVCENVLATTRSVYKLYAADMKSSDMPRADMPNWRNQAIATAEPHSAEEWHLACEIVPRGRRPMKLAFS